MDAASVAEDMMAYAPLPVRGQRVWVPGGCLSFQPGGYPAFAHVSAVRIGTGSVDEFLEVASAWFTETGVHEFVWFLGPSTTPSGLAQRLLDQGASAWTSLTAMVLRHAPDSSPGLEIEDVVTADQLLSFWRVMLAGHGSGTLTGQQESQLVSENSEAWADYQALRGARRYFLIRRDDEPVAAGGILLTDQGVAFMSGGATLPAFRGQGCYRALLRARWDAAEAAGITQLAVQASELAAPILARNGFTAVADLNVLRMVTREVLRSRLSESNR